jgi:hypothetical protein
MDAKVEHLKLVQGVINRLASNSFLLKGWTVTLIAALFALAVKDSDRRLAVVAWIPLLVIAGLDAYFLWQEKLFIRLFREVANRQQPADFSMDVGQFKKEVTFRAAVSSRTIIGFYIPMILAILAVTIYFIALPETRP